MNIDILEDYMDKMIDEGKIDLKDGLYFLKESAAEMENGRESEEN